MPRSRPPCRACRVPAVCTLAQCPCACRAAAVAALPPSLPPFAGCRGGGPGRDVRTNEHESCGTRSGHGTRLPPARSLATHSTFSLALTHSFMHTHHLVSPASRSHTDSTDTTASHTRLLADTVRRSPSSVPPVSRSCRVVSSSSSLSSSPPSHTPLQLQFTVATTHLHSLPGSTTRSCCCY